MTSARQIYLGSRRGPALPYDSEVEYLESTGTQWIDTGVKVAADMLVEATFELLAIGNVVVFGGRQSTAYNAFAAWATTSADQKIRFDFLDGSSGGDMVVNTITSNLFQQYRVSKIGPQNFVDGVEVQNNSNQPLYAANRNCYLFAINNGGTASFIGNLRIGSFSITGLRDMIPVRFTNEQGVSEGAMYDRVSGQLFRNQGTGAFNYGNDK